MRADAGASTGWLIHDLVIGALAGGFGGLILALVVMARTTDTWTIGGTIIGMSMVIGVLALRFERNRRPRAGLITVIVWIVLIVAGLFLTLLIDALRDFT